MDELINELENEIKHLQYENEELRDKLAASEDYIASLAS